MKKTFVAIAAVGTALLVGGCGSPDEPSGPTNEELATQIEAAYVPAKSCWNSFLDDSCPDVLETVWEDLQLPYKELQRQGRTESVRELASVHKDWNDWLTLCMTSKLQYLKNGTECLSTAPGSSDINTAAKLVRAGN